MEAKNIGKDKQKTKMMQGIAILKVLNYIEETLQASAVISHVLSNLML